MEAGTAKTKAEKAPVEPVPFDAEVAFAALTAKVDQLEAGIASQLEAEVAKYLGDGGELAVKVNAALESLEELVQAKTEALGEEAGTELEKLVAWAHAKIGALHNGVQRAIGITIPLPEGPTSPAGDVEVTGTETADGLAK